MEMKKNIRILNNLNNEKYFYEVIFEYSFELLIIWYVSKIEYIYRSKRML